METNRFFRFMWRLNSVIIMLAAISITIVLSVFGWHMYRDATGRHNVSDVVNVDGRTNVPEHWVLGSLSTIGDSPYAMLHLLSKQVYQQSYYEKGASSTRNILFIDARTNENFWLFDTNKYLILNSVLVGERVDYREPKNVKAILYTIVKADSDGDKRITYADKKTVALSLPSGLQYKEIAIDVESQPDYKLINDSTILLVYLKKGKWNLVTVTLPDFKIIRQTEMQKMKS